MVLFCFGFSHSTAPFDFLGRVGFTKTQMEEFLSSLSAVEGIAEAIGLSTCNRTEFYWIAPSAKNSREILLRSLSEAKELSREELLQFGRSLQGPDALQHLFRLASGLESLVIGEHEILGQVKAAQTLAKEVGSAGPRLQRLFSRAATVGRRVRVLTGIGEGSVSVASLAAQLGEQTLGGLNGRRALVLGAGAFGEQVARCLDRRGVEMLLLANRTQKRADELLRAMQCPAQFLTFDDLTAALVQVDLLVCATGAPHAVVHEPMVRQAMAARGGRTLLLFDLCNPRNIEPACAQVPGVRIFTLDSLEGLASENRIAREDAMAEAETLVREAAQRAAKRFEGSPTGDLNRNLRGALEVVRQEHLDRNAERFPEELQRTLERFSESLSNALLHRLSEAILALDPQSAQGRQDVETLRRILLDQEKPASEPPASATPPPECPYHAHHVAE